MENFQLVWTQYGEGLALGIRNLSDDKTIMEQIYNLFFNYGIINGEFHEMNQFKFGYFLIKNHALNKVKNINTELGRKICYLLSKDFIEENFLRQH